MPDACVHVYACLHARVYGVCTCLCVCGCMYRIHVCFHVPVFVCHSLSVPQAPIQRIADRIASVFVPLILLLSSLTFLAWLAVVHVCPILHRNKPQKVRKLPNVKLPGVMGYICRSSFFLSSFGKSI